MPRTLEAPEKRRKAFGVSLSQEEVDRIDALADSAYPGGAVGKRSQFITEAIYLGLERRYGPNWREFADALRTQKAVVAA